VCVCFFIGAPLQLYFGSVGRTKFHGRRFYGRHGILSPVDSVALTRKWIRVTSDSTKTLKLRLVAEVIKGLACHAAARHMPSRLGWVKHVHNA
jgi:hypothetical protein